MGSDGVVDIEYKDIGQQVAVLSDPDRMEKMVLHISCGGTLVDYCKLTGQSYPVVLKWIKDDPKRLEAYEAAKEARQDWLFERVLQEYTAMSTFELSDIYNSDGALKPVDEWSKGAKAMLAGVESFEIEEMIDGEKVPVGTLKKVKLWDKTKTLEALGRYLKMFREQIDLNVNGRVSLVDALAEAESRARLVSEVESEESVGQVGEDKQEPI